MLNKLPTKVTVIVVLAIIATVIMAGCGSNSSQSTPSSSEQSVQQSTQQTTQQSTQQSGTQSGQQQPPSGQAPDNSKMDAVNTRAAAILGVSADSFKKAFQNAMPQGGGSGSGQQGQPPAPTPGDNTTGHQGQLPSGQQPPAAPSGSSGQGPDMTDIYTKMATELNVTADAIAKAMAQAQQELQK